MRPTGLVDPEVIVKPTKGQIDDLLEQINERVTKGDRVLVTTLTKKMAEDLTDYLLEHGVRVRYLHSNIDTIQRIEILRDLRLGEFDVLVGINLLREGLDLPEVSLVAILDADKEGFLRSRDLADPDDRASRPQRRRPGHHVRRQGHRLDAPGHLETHRRRGLQQQYNVEHGIDPQTILQGGHRHPRPAPPRRRRHRAGARGATGGRQQRARSSRRRDDLSELAPSELGRLIQTLEEEMHEAAADLRFEYAARLRDEINELRRELRDAG